MPLCPSNAQEERLNPEVHASELFFAEHWARYRWAAQLAAGKRIADVACGTGYGCGVLADAGATAVVGMDLSVDTITQAASKYRSDRLISFLVSDATTLPLGSESCDLIVSFETIEHLPDAERFIAEAARVVRRSGALLVSTPNPRAYAAGNPFHINELSPSGFEQLLRSHFEHVELYYQSDWLCSAILATSELERFKQDVPIGGALFKVAAMPRLECPYILAFCSNSPLSNMVAPVGVLIRDQQTQIEHSRQLQFAIGQANELITGQQQRLQELSEEFARIARNNQHLVDSVQKMVDTDALRRVEVENVLITTQQQRLQEAELTAAVARLTRTNADLVEHHYQAIENANEQLLVKDEVIEELDRNESATMEWQRQFTAVATEKATVYQKMLETLTAEIAARDAAIRHYQQQGLELVEAQKELTKTNAGIVEQHREAVERCHAETVKQNEIIESYRRREQELLAKLATALSEAKASRSSGDQR